MQTYPWSLKPLLERKNRFFNRDIIIQSRFFTTDKVMLYSIWYVRKTHSLSTIALLSPGTLQREAPSQ